MCIMCTLLKFPKKEDLPQRGLCDYRKIMWTLSLKISPGFIVTLILWTVAEIIFMMTM
jgi:hypothetical protein